MEQHERIYTLRLTERQAKLLSYACDIIRHQLWLDKIEGEKKLNPYSGISFEYNGHTWGMCARDGGVEILMDSELKVFVSLDKSFVYPIYPQPDLAPKEPKFKVGDWILYSGDHYEGVRHITKIDENGYYIERNGLPHGIIPFNHEICMRLWTIQDANDGDVLFAKNFDNIGGCVFLFNGLDSWKFDTEGDMAIATGYCCTSITESGNTDFGIQGPDCIEIKRVHPATKSQRDLLFQKMHEAGYEWDAEKKELKLLITNGGDFLEAENCEQKPIDYNEDLKKLK